MGMPRYISAGVSEICTTIAIFWVFSSHMGLVATLLDSIDVKQEGLSDKGCDGAVWICCQTQGKGAALQRKQLYEKIIREHEV